MTDTPKIWRDMTPEQKGALLLAHHEGKVIEALGQITQEWMMAGPAWNPSVAYRIRPEPKRETVTMHGGYQRCGAFQFAEGGKLYGDTHTITFDLVDGKPDPASVKLVEVET